MRVLSLLGLSLAASIALSACGGGSGGATPHVTSPGGSAAGAPSALLSAVPKHYTIIDLGAGVTPTAVNLAGHVTGTAASHAFFYDGTMHTLAPGFANDINNADVIVGGIYVSSNQHPARFNIDGSVTDLGFPAGLPNAPGYSATGYANAINDSGAIVATVAAQPICTYGAYVLSNGSWQGAGGGITGIAINDSGTAYVEDEIAQGDCSGLGDYYPQTSPQFATPHLSNETRDFDGNGYIQGTDINNAGYFTGWYAARDTTSGSADGIASFLSNSTTTQEIDPPGGLNDASRPSFQALAINTQNWIVGFVKETSGNYPVIWSSGTFTNLQTLVPANCNWILGQPADISDSGYIVGIGTFGGSTHGYLLVPQP